MTNSEKQTKSKPESQPPTSSANSSASAPAAALDQGGELPAYTSASFWKMVGGVLLLMGFAFSLQINSWHFTVPVAVQWFGWAGVLLTVRLLWGAGVAAVSDSSGDSFETLDVSDARRHELLAEKKSLIKAIKEIEFDRDLDKMSDEDAAEMMKFYRARAIAVIKELDGQADSSLSVAARVERDLQARLAIVSKTQPSRQRNSSTGRAKGDTTTSDVEESA